MNSIYTTLEEAEVEIRARRQNRALFDKVSSYIGDLPRVFEKEPRAVLFRNVMTPNYEFLHFLNLSKKISVRPLGMEYLDDQFCTRSPDKVSLGRVAFCERRDRHGEPIISYNRVFDLMAAERQPIRTIQTHWGEGLVDFHHRLLATHAPDIELFDISTWHRFNGNTARDYYKYYLAFFVCHGILFENFVTSVEEEVFTRNVVIPAFREVEAYLGARPIVVKLDDEKTVCSRVWNCYHSGIEEMVKLSQGLCCNGN